MNSSLATFYFDFISVAGIQSERGMTYHYVVVAWNGYEESEPSEEVIINGLPDRPHVTSDWMGVVVAGGSGIGFGGGLFVWCKLRRKNARA